MKNVILAITFEKKTTIDTNEWIAAHNAYEHIKYNNKVIMWGSNLYMSKD